MRRAGLSALGRLVRALALVLAACLAIALEAAPLGLAPLALPSPDLVACVVAVWVVRTPEAVPLALIFAIGLMRDLVTDIPPGLGALSLVVAAEIVRSQRDMLVRQPFAVEWLWVGLALAVMMLLQWGVVLLSLSQPPYIETMAEIFGITLAAYPLVAATARWGLRLRATPVDP